MEARLVHGVPDGPGWLFEPKWDGFRCVAYKDGAKVALQSKAGQSLGRYFPDVVHAVEALPVERAVLDGEIVALVPGGFAFEPLLLRIHPAERRVRQVASQTAAALLVFDLLVDERGRSLLDRRLAERRAALETFAARHLVGQGVALSPASRDRAEAMRWLAGGVAGIDGVVAKRLDGAYAPGERAVEKVKLLRTADCVVGGLRWAAGKGSSRQREIGSLLLGLYGEDGLLHYVGHAASFDAGTRHALTTLFLPLVNGSGFSGTAPGPSRWSRGRLEDWIPVRPDKVVEVEFHHASDGRLRHGARFLRTRPDKAPRTCTLVQISAPRPPAGRTQSLHGPA